MLQNDALKTSIISYVGAVLGYINKGLLFVALLSIDEIGILNLLLSTSILFAQFSNLGTYNVIWRFFPSVKRKDNHHYGFLSFNILIALVGAVFFTLLLLLFYGQIEEYYSEESARFMNYFFWTVPTGIAILLNKLLDGYSRAIYKSVFSIFSNDLLLRLFTTIVLVGYYFELFGFDVLLIILCLSQWLPVMLVIFYLKKLGEWNVSHKNIALPRKLKRVIYYYSSYVYMNSIGANIVLSIDAIMVAGMLGLEETGVYTTVMFMSRVLVIPYSAILRVASPLIPKYWKNNAMDDLQSIYLRVSSVSLLIGLYLFGGVWITRQDLFIILPEEFKTGIYVFLCIMIGRISDMYGGLNSAILITSKKYKSDLIFTGILVVLVIYLNYTLIPIYGVLGAAVSTSVAFIVYNVLRVLFVWWHYKLHPFSIGNLYVFIVFGGVIFLFEIFSFGPLNVFVSILLKGAVFTGLFLGTIYVFKIEPNFVRFVDKWKFKLLKIK